MFGIIATWRMALEGIQKVTPSLKDREQSDISIVNAIKEVENFEYYKSVGYGGLPNKEMVVELDAGFMDGDNFNIGMIGAIKDFENPIEIARRLAEDKVNNFLVDTGAEKYASINGFNRKNMLTSRAKIHYKNKLEELKESQIKPYDGHDTVGMVCLDVYGKICSATSTSGLFMKHPGRLGDSPIVGSGFYADSSIGGACATGLGEDIMKGCASYEIVRLMGDGKNPQEACETVVYNLNKKLSERRGNCGDISVVAMDKNGEWGCATNIDGFSFVVATEQLEPTVFLVSRENKKMVFKKADEKWMKEYMESRMRPLE